MKADTTRRQILKLEKQIASAKSALSKLRDRSKPELIENYELVTFEGKKTTLSDLFGKKSELILIHNMGSGCPYCTLWADGFNGILHHLEDRAAFIVESPQTPQAQASFRKKRNWKFKMVSSAQSSFRSDLGFGDSKEGYWPGVSTFLKKNGKIYRHSHALFGPGDNYCIAWDLFDLLPGKATDWEAKFKY